VDLGWSTRVGDVGCLGRDGWTWQQIDREGRPLTGNALLGCSQPEAVSNQLKEEYNAATPQTRRRFVPEIRKALGLYDAFDGRCGINCSSIKKPRRRCVMTQWLPCSRTTDSGSIARRESAHSYSLWNWQPREPEGIE